jgi:hypothetical protein
MHGSWQAAENTLGVLRHGSEAVLSFSKERTEVF